MALNIPGALFESGIFQNMPEDGTARLMYGTRHIYGNSYMVEAAPLQVGTATPPTGQGWNNPSNARVSDDTYADSQLGAGANTIWVHSVSLYGSSGTVGSTEIAVPTTEALQIFGGPNNLWGKKLTPANINSQFFYFRIAYEVVGAQAANTQFLSAAQFNFQIPSNAIIKGVEALVEHKRTTSPDKVYVDQIRVRVYYVVEI